MRGRGNVCHTKIVDPDGHVRPCLQPVVGVITIRDGYGQPIICSVCAECKATVMEGADE